MTSDVIYAGMSCQSLCLPFLSPSGFASMQRVWPSTQKGWRPFEGARGEHTSHSSHLSTSSRARRSSILRLKAHTQFTCNCIARLACFQSCSLIHVIQHEACVWHRSKFCHRTQEDLSPPPTYSSAKNARYSRSEPMNVVHRWQWRQVLEDCWLERLF
jgi:hypothetical protein